MKRKKFIYLSIEQTNLRLKPVTKDSIMLWENRNSYVIDENEKIIGLNISSPRIKSWRFLEDYPNLNFLNLPNNSIVDVDFLDKLTKLTHLNISYNPIDNLNVLKNLRNIEVLLINGIRANDYNVMGRLGKLTQLSMYSNNLSKIDFLKNNLKLEKLYLADNKLSDITGLIPLINLETLDLSSNILDDLSPLENLKSLSKLYIGRNNQDISFKPISKLKSLTHLRLDETNLRDLSFLKMLKNLIYLDLSRSYISDFSSISNLQKLQFLHLNQTELSNLKFLESLVNLISLNLSENKLVDCNSLVNLTKLTTLNLNENQIKSIEWCKNLTLLEILDLNSNEISDISSVKHLVSLQQLVLNNNYINDISEIANLKKLEELHIFNNKVDTIYPLKHLKHLRVLDFDSNNVSDIEPIYSLIKKGIPIRDYNNEDEDRIDLQNNPLNRPPLEFINLGNETILEYFEDSKKFGNKAINECKLIFIGDGGAGKTSLMKRLVFDEFNNAEATTHGINKIAWKEICNDNGEEIRVNLWDFGGQHLQHSLHQFFLSKRVIYVLVLNPRNDEKADYWLKQIENLGDESEVLVVYNWKHPKDKEASYLANYYELQKTYPYISKPFLLSCKNNEGVTEFKDALRSSILKQRNLKDQYPLNWFNIKNSLEELVTLEKNYISYEGYEKICEDNFYFDEVRKKNLLTRLDNIGSIVFFEDPSLMQLQVLNPDWITTFAYSIITSEITNKKNGHLTSDDLKSIFKDPKEVFSNKITKVKYREDQFDFIIKLMIKYDLCQKNPFNPEENLFPSSFKGSPEGNYSLIKSIGKHYRFLFDTEFEMLIIHRFIARNIKNSTDKDFWQSGIYINDFEKKTFSLIETNRHSKVINCWITGENIRGLWEVIRNDVKDICGIYDNLYYQEQILYTQGHEEGVFLSYYEMLTSLRRGRRIIDWHPTYDIENIDVLNVLENFEDTTRIMADLNKNGVFINNGNISNSLIGGTKNTLTNYINTYSDNPTIVKLKDILEDLEDAAKANFEWQENFSNALTAIYKLEEADNKTNEKKQISKLNKFFNKAKEVKDWAAITLLPAEVATKGNKMIKMGEDLLTHLSELLQ